MFKRSIWLQLFILSCVSLGFASDMLRERYEFKSNDFQTYAQTVRENTEQMEREFKKNHIGLELIFSEGSFKQIESLTGHVFLRLIDEDNDDSNDTTISFNMVSVNKEKKYENAFKGAGNIPLVGILLEKIVQYMKYDSRPLVRHILPTTPERLEVIKGMLLDIAVANRVTKDYNFVRNNCMTAILRVLKHAGYPVISKTIADIPSTIGNILEINGMSYYPRLKKIVGAADVIEKLRSKHSPNFLEKTYNFAKESVSDFEAQDIHEMEEFKNSIIDLNQDEFNRLIYFWPYKWVSQINWAYSLIETKSGRLPGVETYLPLAKLDSSLYQVCELDDMSCVSDRSQAAIDYFGEKKLKSHLKKSASILKQEIRRSKGMINEGVRLTALRGDIPQDLSQFNNYLNN